jgi:hypothetical protein
MSFQLSEVGKECPFCHAAKLVQYKSGKIGCGALCWKNKPDDYGSYNSTGVQNPKISTRDEILLETMQEGFKGLNERLDSMGKFFAKKEKAEREEMIEIDDGEL